MGSHGECQQSYQYSYYLYFDDVDSFYSECQYGPCNIDMHNDHFITSLVYGFKFDILTPQ